MILAVANMSTPSASKAHEPQVGGDLLDGKWATTCLSTFSHATPPLLHIHAWEGSMERLLQEWLQTLF